MATFTAIKNKAQGGGTMRNSLDYVKRNLCRPRSDGAEAAAKVHPRKEDVLWRVSLGGAGRELEVPTHGHHRPVHE